MRAIHHTIYGGPDVLSLVETPRPVPRDHQVLIAVAATSVTQGDRRLRAADFPGISWLPGRLVAGLRRPRHAVPGTTFAGRIAEVGAAVTRFAVGDEVFGITGHGACAEYLVVADDSAIARAPAGLAPAEAAALVYGATTALVFLRDLGRVQPGERVAILGATGEVGRAAVQIARHLGAEVTAVCRRDGERARALGADRVVASVEDIAGHDVVFDTTDAHSFAQCRAALAPRGRYLTLRLSLASLLAMAATAIVRRRRAIVGVAMPTRPDIEALRDLAEAGAVRPVIARRFPLARAAEAHVVVEAGRSGGSVVVEPTERLAA